MSARRLSRKTNNRRFTLAHLLADEAGDNLVEYALVVALLALAAIASMRNLGNMIVAAYANINSTFSSAI